ncbi:P-loop containing nucleoside triphosphate hydrolase protein [Xylariomycetidae sp. FL2044]|nr:P-loop containing nucleoside triphosphate hydrolase protein [Xylariomycetidae sp. FL2044]KAH9892223.1 P-loop containing nucleoside triphosphate hydrolase protein [Xylariomycetidae sp. FL2044]
MGILAIVGMAGSGKTHMLARMVNYVINTHELDKVILCAPTHTAVQNAMDRIEAIQSELMVVNQKYNPHIFVHGFDLSINVDALIGMVTSGGKTMKPWDKIRSETKNHWRPEMSPCVLALKVLKFAGEKYSWELSSRDNRKLEALRDQLAKDPEVSVLFSWTRGEITWEDLNANRDEVINEWQAVHGDTPEEDRPDKPRSARGLIMNIMEQLLAIASVVGSTTHASMDPGIKRFTKDAKLTVLDEAGAMTIPEALIPWQRGRPLIMAGDPLQLPPFVAAALWKKDGLFVNMLAEMGKISLLEFSVKRNWPSIWLNCQRRMVNGGFDIAKELIYNEVRDFSYHDSCSLANHPHAMAIENQLISKFNIKSYMGMNAIYPVFINVPDSTCQQDPMKSSYNEKNLAVVFKLAKLLIVDAGISPSNIVTIVPYKAQLATYIKEVEPNKELAEATSSTIDSYQGKEKGIVIADMTRTESTGPGFLKDPQRLNVMLTRHTDFLFLVGDINLMGDNPLIIRANERETIEHGDDGTTSYTSGRLLRKVLQWFKTKKRVIEWEDKC